MTPFSDHPLKWSKYLLLVQFGFVTHKELEHDIKRYKSSDRSNFLRDISLDLRAKKQDGRRDLYVVKLVSRGLGGRLPNYRLERLADLNGLSRFLSHHEDTDYVEIWYCRTRVDAEVFSVAGRFIFTHEDSDQTQSVEQVWRCSPRLLEYYSRDFEYPYVRASRYSWNWRYSVEHVHIPKPFGLQRPELLHEFNWSMHMFECKREQLAIFLSFLDSFGFLAYSIEYKIVGSRLSIIDWDTPDDRRVVMSRNSKNL